MKKIRYLFLATLLIKLSIASGTPQPTMTQSILTHVIYPSLKQSQTAIAQLKKALKGDTTGQRTPQIEDAFAKLIIGWKQVQATYIVGELDDDMIDTPRFIDTFHQGNEKLNQQIKRALASGDAPEVALFKNSFKSINALEILLYRDDKLSQTEKRYADYILSTIDHHLTTIKSAYQQQASQLSKDQDKSVSYWLNALIDSAFKLKEWRVGEAAGLAKKYKDKPDNSHQEYLLSANSLVAIGAIIASHNQLIGNQNYPNLGTVAIQQGATKQVKAIRQIISQALSQINQLKAEKITDFKNPRIKLLYNTLSQLSDAYYHSLVQALPVQAKILDADGD